jgi:hypothetical protein
MKFNEWLSDFMFLPRHLKVVIVSFKGMLEKHIVVNKSYKTIIFVMLLSACFSWADTIKEVTKAEVIMKTKLQFNGLVSSWDMDEKHNLFVVDSKNKLIVIYDKHGSMIKTFSIPEISNYSYCGISVDESGNAFIYPREGWGNYYVYNIRGEKRGRFMHKGKLNDFVYSNGTARLLENGKTIFSLEKADGNDVPLSAQITKYKYISDSKHGWTGIELESGKKTPYVIKKGYYFSQVVCVDSFNKYYALYSTRLTVENKDSNTIDYITAKFNEELNVLCIYPFYIESKMIKNGQLYTLDSNDGYLEVLKWAE